MFLVLGNATVDESMAADVWPTPSQTIVVRSLRRDLGGKGANQALALKRTGSSVRLVAAVGRDSDGAWIAERLSAEGLQEVDLLAVDAATDRSLIFVSPEGENAIASTVAAAKSIDPNLARDKVSELAPDDILVMQGNLSLAATEAALLVAHSKNVRTILNPSPLQAGFVALLPLVNLLVVNEGEAAHLVGPGDPPTLAAALRSAGVNSVALTLGGRGSIFDDGTKILATPAPTVPVIDTTGAGDAFTGVLIGALYHRRLAPSSALVAATAAAALTVQRLGAASAFPSRAELEAIFNG